MNRFLTVVTATALTCAACGGGSNTSVSVVVPPPPPPPPPAPATPTVTTQPAFTNLSFNQGLALKQAPGDASRWFVVEKGGAIQVFANDPNTSAVSVFLDISARVDARGEGGLLGIAFHPDYPTTAEVFVSYTRSGLPLVSYVSRFSSSDMGQTLDEASEEVLLTVAQPEDNHNGGDIAFGPDGFLYVGFGDGGGSGDPDGNAQDTTNLMGSIIRIDVEGGSPYAIPPGNPFEANTVCASGTGSDPCPEIFAWGLRNPWRFSFDPATQDLWAGDVGQGAWEEIDLIEANANYGWDIREGAHCFDPPTGCANNFVEPITEYDRSLGRSVTGGYVYRGAAIPELAGWYLFGDFITGRLFGIPSNSAAGVLPEVLDQTGLQIVSFGVDSNGEIYLIHFGGGTLHQVVDVP